MLIIEAIFSNIEVRLALVQSKVPMVTPNVKSCCETRLGTFDDFISSSSRSVSVSITIILGESIDISVKSIIGCDVMLLLIALIFVEGVR